ncbi:MAG: hypothetical protein ACFFBI_14895 [Promethearchaeota archaeon]
MSERSDIENILTGIGKKKGIRIKDTFLKLLDNVIQEFAPEVSHVYQIREDETEQQQIKTGRLHENRILGIFLKYYLEGNQKLITQDVEREYRRYFRGIARSTLSTYLNELVKDSTLHKERDGRNVFFTLCEDPPNALKSFWFTRIFCIVPAYFNRAVFFANIYLNAETYVLRYINQNPTEDKKNLSRNFKYLLGLVILQIFKNRTSNCVFCQFSKRKIYQELEEVLSASIEDRSDVLPDELLNNVIKKCSEIPMFKGIDINDKKLRDLTTKNILKSADLYRKDIDFQIMVSGQRKDLRLKQKKALDEDNMKNIKYKVHLK